MELSEALQKMIEFIQESGHYTETYELMLSKFMQSQDNGDTIRMSFEFAKAELKPTN